MTEEELNIAFDNAYERACNTKIQLPPDVMLHFYAYYKRATHTEGFFTPSGDSELRNAFKLNAFFQAKNLTPKQAKEKYIELVNEHITD
ncbi:acyl-CoA-binding protein [Aquimarina sp. MAR_2010_214]|uniref:acyl-CoA-binding protein n=1 Tax=Aquimarina sp. MAR_2010_214 TaxID=1250026 RepID=UPI000C7106F5|nr:acyl-CoA-binding protein [Aquimarina sp. MAR_2010_214]PKV52503.1 acyl-CoA-binding protein [Aquimarina sp. MAR_2010_214]